MTSFNDVIPGYIFSGLFFTEKFLKKNPERVKAYLRGLVKAFRFIREHEEKARQWIPKYTGVEKSVAMRAALRAFDDGREPLERLYKQQEIMVKIGKLPQKVAIEEYVDYSWLP